MVERKIKLITKIADGGQNFIYLGKDIETQKRLVVKMSKPSEKNKLQRLLIKEATIGHALNGLDCVIQTHGLMNKLVKW